MTVTIYDVAREAKVSMATVSRVLNGNPNVKPETRKKVKEVIKRLNYRPNAIARGLASKKTTTVGVIIPDISNLYYSSLARGLDDIAEMYNYQTIITNTDNNPEKERDSFLNLVSKQVDGIVFLGGTINDETIEDIKNSNVPVVICGTSEKDANLPSVNIDYFKAIKEVATHLLDKGAKDIYFIKALYSEQLERHIEDGLKEAYKEYDLPFKEEYTREVATHYHAGREVFDRLIDEDDNVDVLLTMSDEAAVGMLHGALDRGISFPNRLQLVSCSNTRLVHMMRPPVTSIAIPLYDIGAVGMRLLTKYMKDEPVDEPNVILPYAIEYRASTK
ncbi:MULTISPECIES: catabolite control protein A [Salinicoccus]|uniref:Catabolite control protein A n=2 Tax=Salinicoccus TaxID=45669 RepID=A0A285UG84_9STAP|nr:MULTISPECIES: catabolite control protein A [Salinicoccus]MCD2137228.1 catabolite control protein A [Salinicoccus halitifaciens]SOC39281.1 LacI family transcriptional regulator [Salinicoccus kekensis]